MNNPLLDHALHYVRLGWPIFPLHNPNPDGTCSCGDPTCGPKQIGKHPRTSKGVYDATRDERQVQAWWRRWPNANIGLATGDPSGVWVLDLDRSDALQVVEEHLQMRLPRTESVRTGRGRHLYWHHPEGLAVANRASLIRPESGIDVRGTGGYVILPPSLHSSGSFYEWEPDGPDQGAVGAPDALVALVQKNVEKPVLALVKPADAVQGRDIAAVVPLHKKEDARHAKYLQGALDRAEAAIRSMPEGGRNDLLNKEAYSLAGLGIPDEEIRRTLTSAALFAGLTQKEADKSISSGIRAGRGAPREIPESTLLPKRRAAPTGPANGGGDGQGDNPGDDSGGDKRYATILTDTGNAERFLRDHADDVRYVASSEKWYIWDGTRWVLDRTLEVCRKVKATIRKIIFEADGMPNETEEDEKKILPILQWAHKSESAERRSACLRLVAQDGMKCHVVPEQFDSDGWLLNVANGVINLRDGELLPHKREMLMTKMVPISYDKTATCPRWEKFLSEVMQGNTELIEFLQIGLGYTLTGQTTEQCLFFMHGTGSNGKTTFLEVLQEIMAEYGEKAEFKTFMVQKNDGPRNDLAGLKGARYVAASESEGGASFAEAFLKEVTGGDTVRCRFLHEEFFSFKPQFKIWLAANYKPIIKGTDDGIWRRLRLIPFDAKFENEQKDLDLPRKLREELPGILAWVVRGTLRWQKEGLPNPKRITEATAAYREDMDILGDFLASAKHVIKRTGDNCPSRSLYKAYKQWAADEDTEPVSEVKFGLAMAGKGFAKKKMKTGNFWQGISVVGIAVQTEMIS